MPNFPWLTFVTSPGGNTLTCHQPSLHLIDPALENDCKPSIVTFVGKRTKTILLSEILSDATPVVHKEVFLWSSPQLRGTGSREPLLVIDCGVQNARQPPNPAFVDTQRPTISWSMPKVRNFNAALCGKIFLPFSNVLCCFVSDLGGPRAVTRWLAEQATTPKASDLPSVPRVLLVVDTTADTFDEGIAANKAGILLCEAMQCLKRYSHPLDAQRDLQSCFKSIEVIGLQSWKSNEMRGTALKRRLIAMSDASAHERASTFTNFTCSHFLVLTNQLINHFSSGSPDLYRFAHASRAHGFSTVLLESCLTDFLNQLPSQAWLWHFAAPIIASALLLSSYPPRSHEFAPDYLFNELYSTSCRAAIASYTPYLDIQSKFLSAVLAEFSLIFTQYYSGKSSAREVHLKVLRTHHPHLADLKSHRSCFCCFMRMPEKVLSCGHAYCDSCIKTFGSRSSSERNTYEVFDCVLCGVHCQNSIFRFVPPTAGIRTLTVDGGGVKGVSPLMYLQHLDNSLASLGCAVREYFDYVCGTSAGGLVVIGMFLLQWGTTESLQRFEETAGKTFGKRKALLARALQLITAYVEDGQYSLDAIQEAFRKTFHTSLQMFNPLRNDTKVAVTTTDVNNSLPWLFTNYNGGKRRELGYDVVRAERSENDITVGDAACCTSAAPWFFKPWAVHSLGTYQDGGLRHNNPAGMARWESRFIWPNRIEPDFALSLGTGTSSAPAECKSWWKLRFTFRLYNSFMRTLDSEDAYQQFLNSLPPTSRHRYHRLNIHFPGPEPSLDDPTRIPELKARVSETIKNNTDGITALLDSMIASIFYFLLDDLPTFSKEGYTCSGYIFCRLDMPSRGLRFLYNRLFQTSSWFLIQGNPIQCVERIPKHLPPFKRRVTFRVDSLDKSIAFSIRGITTTSKLLSGFPTSLSKLITEQGLDSPFGTIDHGVDEKPLPAIPTKRNSTLQQNRKRTRTRLQ